MKMKPALLDLYEQSVPLRELLDLKAEFRPRYLSIVLTLPDDIQVQLQETVKARCSEWRDDIHYQHGRNFHLTVVEFGLANTSGEANKKARLSIAVAEALPNFDPSYPISLGAAEIGRSGINLTVCPNEKLKNDARDLQRTLVGTEDKTWYKRGISLVRFKLPNLDAKRALQTQLLALTSPDGDLSLGDFSCVASLEFVELDKVAEYFEPVRLPNNPS